MPIKWLTAVAALAFGVCAGAPLHAAERGFPSLPMVHLDAPAVTVQPRFDTSAALQQSLPRVSTVTGAGAASSALSPADAKQDVSVGRELVDLAMTLRHIRYVRGGHDPATGFDCSGFVRYVFGQAIGLQLPRNAASQFVAGLKVKRTDMQPGDLVFFRTAGRHGRISHVGIYIDHGRFIHSPSRGETVRVDNLTNRYWARRFAGAKRLDAAARLDRSDRNS